MPTQYHLDPAITAQIVDLAKKYQLDQVILFGSRARGDNRERSDIDLAVSGAQATRFSVEVDEAIRTLLRFDVVSLNDPISPQLQAVINKEGIVLYAQDR